MQEITICICTYKRYDLLPLAIESATGQQLSNERYRIIVVDNSPESELQQAFLERYHSPPFLTYHIEPIPGLSNARNVGASLCGTKFIAYMDDDAIASDNWLDELLKAYESFGENVSMVGGKVEPIWGAERPPWLTDRFLGHVSAVDWGGTTRVTDEGEWLAGTNISFRTSDVIDAGGFSVNLGRTGAGESLMSNEEVAIVDRLKGLGRDAVYAPDARVRHLVDESRLKISWYRKRITWQAISDYTVSPNRTLEAARQQWKWAVEYFAMLPVRHRNIRGLFYETEEPTLVARQLDAIYPFTVLMLSGFSESAIWDRIDDRIS